MLVLEDCKTVPNQAIRNVLINVYSCELLYSPFKNEINAFDRQKKKFKEKRPQYETGLNSEYKER